MFQYVCPLMPSCSTYHLTWVSLTLGMGYLFTAAPAKSSRCSLPWTRGILTSALPDLQCGIAPLGPPAPVQPRLLGCGVGPPGHRPWPRAWGHGVAPPARRPWPWAWCVGYLLPAPAPDLGCGVTPLVAAPDLGRGVTPLVAARDLGRRVVSSQQPPAPNLGCGVALLRRSCAVAVWYSRPLPLTSDAG